MSDRHSHDRHDHGHGHDHAHGHGSHRHTHAPASFGVAFAVGIGLNISFVAAEAFYGVAAHSLALLADAGHNLSDVLGLFAAWAATALTARRPSERFTYGFGRTSVLAALGNAMALLIVTGGIDWEAIRRLMHPEHAAGLTIVIVAAAGIAVNGATALMFLRGRNADLNVRAAFLHMASDTLIAFGVVIVGAVIMRTGWLWLDPVISLAISAAIVAGTWSLLIEAVHLSLDAVPPGIQRAQVEAYLGSLPGVVEVHDLHIWGLSTTDSALTAHLVCADEAPRDHLPPEVFAEIRRRFGIGHATIQLETAGLAHLCELRPYHVI